MARYADRLLADGERAVLRTRQHWLAPLAEGRTAWLMLIASLVLVVLDTFFLSASTLRDLFGYFADILLIVSLLWAGWILIGWYSEDYLVTNRRVLKVDGILRKRSADSSLEKINDAILEQSVLGRVFGYGDLEILTAADAPVDHYSFLNGAPQFKRTMLDQKHLLEQEVYDFPGPPLRATAPAGATTAGGSPAPVSSAASGATGPIAAGTSSGASGQAMSSDDITRALGSLADLRDRAAITPEEYEAKKQDLLRRL